MSAGHELRLLGGLVLSTIVLVLPTTTTCLAAEALSPGVYLMAQAAPSPGPSERLVQGEWSLSRRHQYEVYDVFATHPGTGDRIDAVRKMP
jgi:hypothetical protein